MDASDCTLSGCPKNIDRIGGEGLVARMRQDQPLRIPSELLLLILHAVDSQSSLVAWCCLCHGLQEDAEQLLYSDVTLSSAFHVHSFLSALEKAPRRAPLVCFLSVQDTGYIGSVVYPLSNIFPKLTNLVHLTLGVSLHRSALYNPILSTLSTCNFALKSFEPGCIDESGELLAFLTRQTTITSLDLHLYLLRANEPLGQDALPCLKYLNTNYGFFMTHLRTPRSITHLSISGLPTMEDGLSELLGILGNQLVSLKCEPASLSFEGRPIPPPTVPFKVAILPRLRYLEVAELMHEGLESCFEPDDDVFAPVARPNIILETLVWSLNWPSGSQSDEGDRRIQFVRKVARPLLEACPALRRVFYEENYSGGTLFTLSVHGKLEEQPTSGADIPNWKEI